MRKLTMLILTLALAAHKLSLPSLFAAHKLSLPSSTKEVFSDNLHKKDFKQKRVNGD